MNFLLSKGLGCFYGIGTILDDVPPGGNVEIKGISGFDVKTMASLRYRFFLAEGRLNGFHFIKDRNNKQIRVKPKDQLYTRKVELEKTLSGSSERSSITSPSTFSARLYIEGYLSVLDEALEKANLVQSELSDVVPSSTWQEISWWLFHEASFSSGYRDGLQFALACNGDISTIETRIEEKQSTISSLVAFGERSMQPTASPRIVIDSFIAALKDSIEIVLRVKNGEDIPEAYPPDWFISKVQPLLQTRASEYREGSLEKAGFKFALIWEGDLWRLQSEIQIKENGLNQRPPDGRPLTETYINTLKVAISLIQETIES